jgi:hypothetical protein
MKRRPNGTGSIYAKSNGRFRVRLMGLEVGTFGSLEEAAEALVSFSHNKCPRCRQDLPNKELQDAVFGNY